MLHALNTSGARVFAPTFAVCKPPRTTSARCARRNPTLPGRRSSSWWGAARRRRVEHAEDGGCAASVQARADRAEEAADHPAALLQGAVGPNRSARRAVEPALATQCPSPLLSDWRALSVAGCLTTAAVLSVGFGAFISGNKVLAQNMMCATTSKASPGAALGQLAPEAALSSRSRVRPPQTPACLGQPAAWAALALTHRPDFSTQARPGGGSVHHHCSHGRGDKILARQLRRRHCYSRSHKIGAGGTRPSGCK